MAAETLLVRSGSAMGVSLSVVKLEDRRPTGTSGVLQEFCLQRQVEEALYGNGFSQQTGAVYRLLQRGRCWAARGRARCAPGSPARRFVDCRVESEHGSNRAYAVTVGGRRKGGAKAAALCDM